MDEKNFQPPTGFDGVIAALRRHLLEKGNFFEYGPDYQADGEVLASVREAVRMYVDMGYTKLIELGDPPTYAMLHRGHRELHIFQPQDPRVKQWLEDDQADPNNPAIRAYMLQASGLSESDLPVAVKPRNYHINEIDKVFIVATDDD